MTDEQQITALPKDMRLRLPQHLTTSFEIRAPLKGDSLNRSVLQLVRFFAKEFELVVPPINAPVLLYKHVRDLALPGRHYVERWIVMFLT